MLSTLADIADLIAAAGVIASLLFLAVQLREQNRETGLNNWRQLLESLTRFKATTNDPYMADLIVRGNADFHALSPPERLSYGNYLEQGIHIIGNFDKHTGTVPRQLRDLNLAVHNLMHDHLRSPGAKQWWTWARPHGRFMPATARTIARMQAPGTTFIGPHL